MTTNFDPETYYDKNLPLERQEKPRKFKWIYFEYWATKKANEAGRKKDYVEFVFDVVQKRVEEEEKNYPAEYLNDGNK